MFFILSPYLNVLQASGGFEPRGLTFGLPPLTPHTGAMPDWKPTVSVADEALGGLTGLKIYVDFTRLGRGLTRVKCSAPGPDRRSVQL